MSAVYTEVKGKVNTYARLRSKYCKKSIVSCKSMRKLVWLNSSNSVSKMFLKSYSKMSRRTDVVETILIQVYSLKPGALLGIDSITDISVIF